MDKRLTYKEFLKSLNTIQPPDGECHMNIALVMLQGKWKTHVLFELCKHNSIRFGELRRALPNITNTMLANTLRELELYELVSRVQYNEIPPRVEYALTESGKDLLPIFYEICKWTLKHV